MKPSARFKKRYISFSLLLDGSPPAFSEAKKIIHEHFLSFFGENGIAALAFKLVEYSEKDGNGLVRCERSRADEAIFCMALMQKRDGKACRLEPLSTSGSVRRA